MLLTKNVTLPFPLVRKELVRDPGTQTNYCSLGWRGDLKTGVGGGVPLCVCVCCNVRPIFSVSASLR